jgi:hypothetical protein
MKKNGGWFIKPLFREFHVSTEDQLYNKLVEESKKLRCVHCRKEHPIEEMSFPNGDPVCKNCK